jgi:hypothetical protein
MLGSEPRDGVVVHRDNVSTRLSVNLQTYQAVYIGTDHA